jgi:4-nitrophenyl phosphatase
VLADCRGFVFDLDGCVWQGDVLEPGAGETLTALHRAGRGVAFLTNNSRVTGADIRAKLHRLGLPWVEHALTPLEILGQVIAERFGPSRVLVIGSAELAAVVTAAGHELVSVADFRRATVVAVGNDFDLS